MNDVQTVRKGLASLNRSLDSDEFQGQIAKELLHLKNYANERRQLLESLHIRCVLYKQLLERIEQKHAQPVPKTDEKELLQKGAAIISDDLEAIESGILTIERELETIETKRAVMLAFEMSAPEQLDISTLDSATLRQLKENVEE